MSLSKDLVGTHYKYPDHYVVGREKIREYAVAVKNDDSAFHDEKAAADLGHDAILAPLTFISVFGYQAQLAMFKSNNIAIADEKIVQVDQELRFLQPIKAGDRLYCDVYVHSIRQVVRRRHHRDQEHHHQPGRRSCPGDLYDPRGPFGWRRKWL